MTPREAKELLHLVNEPWVYTDLQKYATIRIAELHKLLETETDSYRMASLQGSIRELRQIASLKERVREVSGRKENG